MEKLTNNRGQSLTEYAVVVAVVMAIVPLLFFMKQAIAGEVQFAANQIAAAGNFITEDATSTTTHH